MTRRFGLAAILMAAMVSATGGAAFACSCIPVPRAAVIERAAVAFRGVIVSSSVSADGTVASAEVRVVKVIKGAVPATVIVRSAAGRVPCGYPLIVDAELDFAGRLAADGGLPVDMCGMVPLNDHPWPDRAPAP